LLVLVCFIQVSCGEKNIVITSVLYMLVSIEHIILEQFYFYFRFLKTNSTYFTLNALHYVPNILNSYIDLRTQRFHI
jgi:hypothetical protein